MDAQSAAHSSFTLEIFSAMLARYPLQDRDGQKPDEQRRSQTDRDGSLGRTPTAQPDGPGRTGSLGRTPTAQPHRRRKKDYKDAKPDEDYT